MPASPNSLLPAAARHATTPFMNAILPIPLLNPATCAGQGFVYFNAWHALTTHPYCLYKNPRYLVIQTAPKEPKRTPSQLVLPRSAMLWLTHLVRHPFMRPEGHSDRFDGESLTLRRSTCRDGDGLSGFELHNTSRRDSKTACPQRALISDDFMHEYLVPFMEGLRHESPQ